MKLVIAYLWRHSRGILALSVLAGLVSGAATTGLLALINASLTGSLPRSTLLWSFALLCALVPTTRVVSELLLARLGQDTVLHLRSELSRQLIALPLRSVELLGSDRILGVLTGDVFSVSNAVGLVPTFCINLATVVGALAYLGWLSWKVLLLVILFMVAGAASYQLPMVRAVGYFHRANTLHDVLYGHFQALIEGAKELKLHLRRRESFLDGELGSTARVYREQMLRGNRILSIASSWGQLLVFVVVGLLLYAGPDARHRVLTGYALTLLYLMGPLQMLLNTSPNFTRAGIALKRIRATGLELESDASRELPPPAVVPAFERLELVGATHTYRRENEPGDFTLGPIDLTLARGDLVFVAGGNGSGKTTLAKLLTGLYVPDSGEVLWNGVPVTDENRSAFRQNFSVVFSDFHLFASLLGLDTPELDRDARRYLEVLQLSQKVQVENGKLSTLALSSGQRKRLALLTAYLEDRPVYLFDEWAADQDPLFKEVFYRQLMPELKRRGKTTVVISHDDRYYGIGDRIIKLDSGKLVADSARPEDAELALPHAPAAGRAVL
jgi:putative ATP-binding cassette transporter